jgi:transposase-like protein
MYRKARQCLAATEYFSGRQLGGTGRFVEVDEAIVRRRKYHRGRAKPQIWMIGLAERAENPELVCKVVVKIVKDRRKETLLPIIENHCRTGSIICTDEWRGYTRITSIDGKEFQHRTVCHKSNFVDPVTHTYTNTIEGTWANLRRFLPQHGVRRRFLHDYLWSFLFRHNSRCRFLDFLSIFVNFKDTTYENFLDAMEGEEAEEASEDD